MQLLALLLAMTVVSPNRNADMILINGKIWTGAPNQRFVESLAIAGERILATGSNNDIRKLAGPGTRVIDLKGKLVVPGFIDNHTHFVDGGLQLSRVQLREAASPAEFARRIGDYAKRLGPGKWVIGGNWDHELWSPVTLPTRQMIDEVTPNNPVFVSRLDGHMALANMAALKASGITRDSVDPPGGTIVRDAKGEPTGLLKDSAMGSVWPLIPSATVAERMSAARAGLAEAARFGVTAFCDMSGSEAFEDFRAYQRLLAEDALTSRVYLFMPIDGYQRLIDAGIERTFGSPWLRIGGLKGFADGSLGSSTAAFFDSFEDSVGNTGLRSSGMIDGSLRHQATDANRHELQVAIHAIGDRANDETLAIFESQPDFLSRRFRVEHAQHLNPALIKRFASDRIIASMQPYHAIDDGRWAEKKIGKERAKWTYAFRSLLDAGAILTFGSDWTVAPLDPIQGIHAAVTRQTIDGKNPQGWIPEQRISVEEALHCYTSRNAWAMFMEKEIGRILPGMYADLAVLSDDLFTIKPSQIRGTKVEMTFSGGSMIYERTKKK